MKVEDLILVSVDDHIVEPPTMFEQHLTTAQKAFAPKVLKDKNGADYWLFEGRRAGNIGLNAACVKSMAASRFHSTRCVKAPGTSTHASTT